MLHLQFEAEIGDGVLVQAARKLQRQFMPMIDCEWVANDSKGEKIVECIIYVVVGTHLLPSVKYYTNGFKQLQS